LPIPGMETFILIKHGEYFTVYAKLVNVQVKVGQELNVGDVLATVYTDETENKTELHFEIFKAKSPLNPELWLRN
jgi:septal ring factor EnvC (AmiA/AmiB activator)